MSNRSNPARDVPPNALARIEAALASLVASQPRVAVGGSVVEVVLEHGLGHPAGIDRPSVTGPSLLDQHVCGRVWGALLCG